jgi:hypothetical protein
MTEWLPVKGNEDKIEDYLYYYCNYVTGNSDLLSGKQLKHLNEWRSYKFLTAPIPSPEELIAYARWKEVTSDDYEIKVGDHVVLEHEIGTVENICGVGAYKVASITGKGLNVFVDELTVIA